MLSHKLHTAEAKKFFAEMATKYKDTPNVIYEIWNEPDYYSWKVVKQYSEEVISTIRAIDNDNLILLTLVALLLCVSLSACGNDSSAPQVQPGHALQIGRLHLLKRRTHR